MDSKKLSRTQIQEKLKLLWGWKLEQGVIARQYRFADFASAMGFVNRTALLAQEMDHHPNIDIRYKEVKLALSTHSAGGLTELDFALAQKIDSPA